MTYASNKEFAERSGLGIQVEDENVGTGTGSLDSFDLDNDNIIAGTYTLSYAASGSNNFTALTETTHYTLDKNSGRILLTASGMSTLSTNILYASYRYIENFTDDQVTDLLTEADEEVTNLTGRTWSGSTSATEYYDGSTRPDYPRTNRPYAGEYYGPDTIRLKNAPVRKIDFVYFLANPSGVRQALNYDDNLATYSDITDNVNSVTESPVTAFTATPATNDIIYIGDENIFLGLDIVLSTLGTGSPAITWQYYNGTTWASLSTTEVDTGSSTLEASGKFTWDYPYGWAKTSVNGSEYYWVRGLLTSGYSTAPVIATLTLQDQVSEVLEPYEYSLSGNRTVNFLQQRLLNGVRNVRIDYTYGAATTPERVKNLSIYVAALNAYINLSGGSYDDATSYQLGSKSVTIGEVYVNIREVIVQFEKKIQDLLKQLGRKTLFGAV